MRRAPRPGRGAHADVNGPAGTGKTRLALRLAREVQDRFTDGVFVTFAAAIEQVDRVVPAIARTLALRERPDEGIDALVARHVADRELLLVIDNLEQVPDAATPLSRLLEAGPRLKILATSRVTLRATAEHEFGVAPLEVPRPGSKPGAAMDAASVRLFLRRAEAADPEALDGQRDLQLVGEICRRLDGLPLAIELAAARIRVLPVETLCEGLDQRLSLLTTGRRDAPSRHQTLRAALDWSHQLLTAAERVLFRRLAVFNGGFSLEAALRVCASEELDGAAPIDILQALVESNLVRPVGTVAGVRRFMLLETMREYALEHLAAGGEEDTVRRRHAEITAATVERADAEFWRGAQSTWLPRLDAEHDNIRSAVAWARSADGATDVKVRIAGSLLGFAIVRGHWRELDGWLAHALPASGETARPLRVKCLWSAAVLASYLGRREEAGTHARGLLEIAEQDADQQARAYGLCALGLSRASSEDGRADWEECVRVAEAIGDVHTLCVATGNLAGCALEAGSLDRAQELHAKALALARQFKLEDMELYELTTGAHIAYARDDIVTTEALTRHALPLAVQLGFKEALMHLLELPPASASAWTTPSEPDACSVLPSGSARSWPRRPRGSRARSATTSSTGFNASADPRHLGRCCTRDAPCPSRRRSPPPRDGAKPRRPRLPQVTASLPAPRTMPPSTTQSPRATPRRRPFRRRPCVRRHCPAAPFSPPSPSPPRCYPQPLPTPA